MNTLSANTYARLIDYCVHNQSLCKADIWFRTSHLKTQLSQFLTRHEAIWNAKVLVKLLSYQRVNALQWPYSSLNWDGKLWTILNQNFRSLCHRCSYKKRGKAGGNRSGSIESPHAAQATASKQQQQQLYQRHEHHQQKQKFIGNSPSKIYFKKINAAHS